MKKNNDDEKIILPDDIAMRYDLSEKEREKTDKIIEEKQKKAFAQIDKIINKGTK